LSICKGCIRERSKKFGYGVLIESPFFLSNLIKAKNKKIELSTVKSKMSPNPVSIVATELINPKIIGPGMKPKIKRRRLNS